MCVLQCAFTRFLVVKTYEFHSSRHATERRYAVFLFKVSQDGFREVVGKSFIGIFRLYNALFPLCFMCFFRTMQRPLDTGSLGLEDFILY